jgi:hypothetical protein
LRIADEEAVMKTMHRFLSIAALTSMGTLVPASATAADFVFRIPIDVTNLAEGIRYAKLTCAVSAMKNGVRTIAGWGQGSPGNPDPATGNLPQQIAQVQVNVTPAGSSASLPTGYSGPSASGIDPRDVDHYRCQLELGDSATMPISSATQTIHISSTGFVAVGDPTKPFRTIVEGDIPRP